MSERCSGCVVNLGGFVDIMLYSTDRDHIRRKNTLRPKLNERPIAPARNLERRGSGTLKFYL
jgi:hypothetical protein